MIRGINRNFVCFWKNIRPEEKFPDEWSLGEYGKQLADQLPNGTAPDNICSLFSSADGVILHAVSGYWRAGDYLSELEFAVSLARLAPDERAERHLTRAKTLLSTDLRAATHQALGHGPLRSIDEVLKGTQAGLK